MPIPATEAVNPTTLIQRAKAGDSDALGELYDRYSPKIYGSALRLLASDTDAEDVVHDVFVGLPQALHTFEGRGSFEGWLRRIGTRVALMRLRRRKLMAEVALDDGEPRHNPSPADEWAERLTLEQAFARLPSKLRVVVVLKEIAGYSHPEIAEMERISVANSKSRLSRARKRLRSLLEPTK